MEEVFFIDENCNKISCDNISSHIGLANLIIEKTDLKTEFEQSIKDNPIDFLIEDKGYIAISDSDMYRQVTYDSEFISEKQKRFIQYYAEEGYDFTDFAIERRKLERGEL